MSESGSGDDLLPPILPRASREVFAMNQPMVFRTGGGRGRYLVHLLKDRELVGEIAVPDWHGDAEPRLE